MTSRDMRLRDCGSERSALRSPRRSPTRDRRRRSLSSERSFGRGSRARRWQSRWSYTGGNDSRGWDDRHGNTRQVHRRRRSSNVSGAGDSEMRRVRPRARRLLSSDSKNLEGPSTQPAKSPCPPGTTEPDRDPTHPPRATWSANPTLECPPRETPPGPGSPQPSPPLQEPDQRTPVDDQASDATISFEALSALELLLARVHNPPKPRSRSFGSVLNRFRRRRDASVGETLGGPALDRQFLLQLGDAVSSLAAGKLDKNPGIDPSTWDAVQKAISTS